MSGLPELLVQRARAEGWHMFPLIPGTKRPAVRNWEYAATVPGEHGCPRDNGIACGPTGWVVLDLDTSLDGSPDGVESLGRAAGEHGQEVPLTRLHLTRSGGWQLIFAAIPGREIRNTQNSQLIGSHVDVRGQGGYIVAPGSYVEPDRKRGGWYKIADDRQPVQLPGWIADLLDPPRPAVAERVLQPAATRGSPRLATEVHQGGQHRAAAVTHASPRARLNGLLAAVLAEDELGQNRNNALHWAACRAAEMASDGLLSCPAAMACLEAVGMRVGLDEAEVRRTVASAFRSAR